MTALEGNARKTQFRVGLNDWFRALGWCLLVAAGLWIAVVVCDKLLEWALPLGIVAASLTCVSVLISLAWAWLKRRDLLTAAALLDQAAGLNERTSSGLYCQSIEDPFAQAAACDAEDISSRINPRSFIRLSWPPSLSLAGVALVAALIVTWLPISPLQSEAQAATATNDTQLVKAEVKRAKRKLESLRDRVKKNENLRDLETRLKAMDQLDIEKIENPNQIRREAIKKIDNFSDAVKQQLARDQADMREIKRMFRGLKNNQQPKTPAQQLSQAMAKGDFKTAKDAVKKMREQLARMAQQQDPKKLDQMKKDLENLSKKLKSAAEEQKTKKDMQKELEKQGISKKDAERLLKNLTKKDIQEIKKQMKKNGASDKQMKDMQRKAQAAQKASKQAADMAQAAQKAAQSMQGKSSMADSAEQLQQIADQLNSMEAMDQQLGELESMLSDAQDSKNDMSKDQGQCKQCAGNGCGSCNGTGRKNGRGMGKLGQGKGGRAPIEETKVRFKKVRSPVNTTEGALISKMFVDGEQVRGDISSEAVDLISAAEREATDAIDKNKIPNFYRRSIKGFYSDISNEFGIEDSTSGETSESGQDSDAADGSNADADSE